MFPIVPSDLFSMGRYSRATGIRFCCPQLNSILELVFPLIVTMSGSAMAKARLFPPERMNKRADFPNHGGPSNRPREIAKSPNSGCVPRIFVFYRFANPIFCRIASGKSLSICSWRFRICSCRFKVSSCRTRTALIVSRSWRIAANSFLVSASSATNCACVCSRTAIAVFTFPLRFVFSSPFLSYSTVATLSWPCAIGAPLSMPCYQGLRAVVNRKSAFWR